MKKRLEVKDLITIRNGKYQGRIGPKHMEYVSTSIKMLKDIGKTIIIISNDL